MLYLDICIYKYNFKEFPLTKTMHVLCHNQREYQILTKYVFHLHNLKGLRNKLIQILITRATIVKSSCTKKDKILLYVKKV